MKPSSRKPRDKMISMSKRDARRTANATESMAQQMKWNNATEDERAKMTKDATIVVYAILGVFGLGTALFVLSVIVAIVRM